MDTQLTPEILSVLAHAFSWAIIHSIWQGIFVYLCLRIVLRIIPSNRSGFRYTAAVSALSVQTLWFLYTIFNQYSSIKLNVVLATAGNTSVPADGKILRVPVPETSLLSSISNWYDVNSSLVIGLYLTGIALFSARLLYNVLLLNRLKKEGLYQPEETLNILFRQCLQKIKINPSTRLYVSDRITVPMIIGNIKPVILLPLAIMNYLTIEETESVLLHEMAHIRRKDYFVNVFQVCIETLLFYNPTVWLISSIIRLEREHCCDDMVIGNKEGISRTYANALSRLEVFRQTMPAPSMAATGNNYHLLNRIKRIIEMKNNKITQKQVAITSVAVLLLIATITLVTPNVRAQIKKEKNKEQKEREKTSSTTIQIHNQKVMVTDDKGNITTYSSVDELPEAEKQSLKKSFSGAGSGTIKVFDDHGNEDIVIVKKGKTTGADDIEIIDVEATAANIDELIENAMDKVDWKVLGKEINDSMDAVDWSVIKKELKEALKESDAAIKGATKELTIVRKGAGKTRIEAQQELNNSQKVVAITRDEQVKSINEAHREIEKAHVEIVKAQKRIAEAQKEIAIAQARVAQGSTTYASHDKILDAMQKDGLINRNKGYKIEKKGNELYIDGIKQSKEVYKKYEPMMDENNITIKGNNRKTIISTEE